MSDEGERPSLAPVLVELLLNLIGVFGVGWLMAGHRVVGLLLLTFSLAWLATVAVVTIATYWFGLFCLGPMDLILLIVSTLTLLSNVSSARARA